MTITERIQNSVKAATGLVCYYQSAEELNRLLDYAEFPCAYLFLLSSQQVTTTSGVVRERLTIGVFFVEPTEFDFHSAENEVIIDRCKRRAFKWLRSLMRDSEFRLVATNNTERVYDEFDAILTGFALNVTIEELKGSVCE